MAKGVMSHCSASTALGEQRSSGSSSRSSTLPRRADATWKSMTKDGVPSAARTSATCNEHRAGGAVDEPEFSRPWT